MARASVSSGLAMATININTLKDIEQYSTAASVALRQLLHDSGPMSTHEIHDLINLSLSCLKGLLHELEMMGLIKFDATSKVWIAK
jgi:predicted transcriptional regulator